MASLPITRAWHIRRNNADMHTPHRHLYLAFYDVAHPRRSAGALKLSRSYSIGGQKSVHELWMTYSERDTLVHDMFALLDPDEDRFQIMALDPRSKVYTLGKAVKPAYPDCIYVG